MKTLILTLLLVCVASGQDTAFIKLDNFSYNKIVEADATPSIKLYNPAGKYLTINFSGDTLKTYGTLPLDSASAIFFEWCFERYTGRITELKNRIDSLNSLLHKPRHQ